MHFILSPVGSAGDVHPMVGLALALRARGHRVTMIVSGYFSELMDRCELQHVTVGTREDFLHLANHPDLWSPRRSFRYLFRAGIEPWMRKQFDAIEQLLEDGSVVIGSCLGFGARVARDKLGFPLLTVHLQPAVLWSEHDTPALPGILSGPRVPRWLKRLQFWLGRRLLIDPLTRPAINGWLAELGLPPMRDTLFWWHSPDGVLCLFPPWYAAPQPDWPPNVHLSQFPLWDERGVSRLDEQEELAEFLAAGDAPLAFTPGSAMMFGRQFFEAAIDACGRIGRRGLLLTRFAEHLPDPLPAGMLRVPYAPFSQLFPRCAAVTHHGGIGTTAQGLAAGIPQLIMPMSHDQPDNARRLKQLGVGDALVPARFRGPRLAEQLRRLLDSPATAAACRATAERFAGVEPFAEACAVAEQVTRAS